MTLSKKGLLCLTLFALTAQASKIPVTFQGELSAELVSSDYAATVFGSPDFTLHDKPHNFLVDHAQMSLLVQKGSMAGYLSGVYLGRTDFGLFSTYTPALEVDEAYVRATQGIWSFQLGEMYTPFGIPFDEQRVEHYPLVEYEPQLLTQTRARVAQIKLVTEQVKVSIYLQDAQATNDTAKGVFRARGITAGAAISTPMVIPVRWTVNLSWVSDPSAVDFLVYQSVTGVSKTHHHVSEDFTVEAGRVRAGVNHTRLQLANESHPSATDWHFLYYLDSPKEGAYSGFVFHTTRGKSVNSLGLAEKVTGLGFTQALPSRVKLDLDYEISKKTEHSKAVGADHRFIFRILLS